MSWHKTEVLEEHFKATHEALASSAYLGPCAQANSKHPSGEKPGGQGSAQQISHPSLMLPAAMPRENQAGQKLLHSTPQTLCKLTPFPVPPMQMPFAAGVCLGSWCCGMPAVPLALAPCFFPLGQSCRSIFICCTRWVFPSSRKRLVSPLGASLAAAGPGGRSGR